MSYNASNYNEQGGEVTVIGGTLQLASGATFKVGTTAVKPGHIIAGTVASAADSLAIPITKTIVTKATGADAEALTLADGVPGQIININLVTDGGGDGTLTPATATGWGTIVFADAGDAATLMYVDDTVGWIILGCYGLTTQPTITAAE